jgi:hypothetical protein
MHKWLFLRDLVYTVLAAARISHALDIHQSIFSLDEKECVKCQKQLL